MYEVVVAINIGIFIILALSINIIIGYIGQPTLGHAAFFGIGAYASAILTGKYGIPFILSLPLSGVIAGFIGALLGLASLRVRDDFLAITTIGTNFVVVAIFQYVPFFGASLGMAVPSAYFFGIKINYSGYLTVVIVLIILIVIFLRKLESSWFGMAMGGIRNNEVAAESIGIDIKKFKVIAFVLGTGIAGIAGCVYAHYMTFISSVDFAFVTSITILSMAMVGGSGTIRGPIIGAMILGLTPEVFRFAMNYRMLIYGALLIFTMRFQPEGLMGEKSVLWTNLKKLFKRNNFKKKQKVV
ncbi:MAG: branched-chain amino acid ABC transporter permease [Candidatus Caldatribacteriota bacterium]|nr:branched-chain amino acid ABC transporter permease [Candidatus Caldatribacteriota bacterium]